MKTYTAQHRVKTVTSNLVSIGHKSSVFYANEIKFEQEFDITEGARGDYWVASSDIEADTWQKALQMFWDKLWRISSRISLIGQGYIDFVREPWLVASPSEFPNIAVFYNVIDSEYVGLYFIEKHKLALEKLLVDRHVSDEFYLYWNDATNTTGYSAKLLLMFAAIEALIKKRNKALYKTPDDFKRKILGNDLFMEIYYDRSGLRNRLSHGEYLNSTKDTKDYVDEVHKKVISFMNAEILKDNLIENDVVQPQRNFNENKTEWGCRFIKKMHHSNSPVFSLTDVIKYINEDDGGDYYSDIGHGEELDKLYKEF